MRKTIIAASPSSLVVIAWSPGRSSACTILRAPRSRAMSRASSSAWTSQALGRSLSGQLVRDLCAACPARRSIAAVCSPASPRRSPIRSSRGCSRASRWPSSCRTAGRPKCSAIARRTFQRPNWNALGDVVAALHATRVRDRRHSALRIPLDEPRPRQFRLHLALGGWTWKLSGLDLPQELAGAPGARTAEATRQSCG